MKMKVIIAFVAAIVIIACSKGNYQSKPTLKIKSLNGNIIKAGGTLNISLEYTDKEGDLSQDTLLSIRKRLNRRPLPPGGISADTLHNIIPKFPEKVKGEFDVTFDWARYLHQSEFENDTIIFKFVAKDRAGHISDTVVTDKIVILKQ
jgi:hypothetical protein